MKTPYSTIFQFNHPTRTLLAPYSHSRLNPCALSWWDACQQKLNPQRVGSRERNNRPQSSLCLTSMHFCEAKKFGGWDFKISLQLCLFHSFLFTARVCSNDILKQTIQKHVMNIDSLGRFFGIIVGNNESRFVLFALCHLKKKSAKINDSLKWRLWWRHGNPRGMVNGLSVITDKMWAKPCKTQGGQSLPSPHKLVPQYPAAGTVE